MKKFNNLSKNEDSDFESLEKRILSLFFSGVYLSTKDIVEIGGKFGYELDFKPREVILKKLLIDAKKDGKFVDILSEIRAWLKARAGVYSYLGDEHIDARDVISLWLHKAKTTDTILKNEILKAQNGAKA
jgi:hypothetical protein